MDTNLRGAFFVAQQTAKRMIARAKGDPKKQHRIINIASVAGLRVLPQIGVYCMSKAGVVQMTKAMAVEWGRYGINVNAICPGYIATEINEDYFDTEQGKKLIEHAAAQPHRQAGRPGRPAAVAGGRGSPFHQRRHHHGRRRHDGAVTRRCAGAVGAHA